MARHAGGKGASHRCSSHCLRAGIWGHSTGSSHFLKRSRKSGFLCEISHFLMLAINSIALNIVRAKYNISASQNLHSLDCGFHVSQSKVSKESMLLFQSGVDVHPWSYQVGSRYGINRKKHRLSPPFSRDWGAGGCCQRSRCELGGYPNMYVTLTNIYI